MLCAASCIQGSSIHGNKPIAELLHHHVEWDGVARSVNDDHEGFRFRALRRDIGIYLAASGSDGRGLPTETAMGLVGSFPEHQLVLTGLRFHSISVPLKYFVISCDYWTVSFRDTVGLSVFPAPDTNI